MAFKLGRRKKVSDGWGAYEISADESVEMEKKESNRNKAGIGHRINQGTSC